MNMQPRLVIKIGHRRSLLGRKLHDFKIFSGNGNYLCGSVQGYTNRQDMMQVIDALRQDLRYAKIEEGT